MFDIFINVLVFLLLLVGFIWFISGYLEKNNSLEQDMIVIQRERDTVVEERNEYKKLLEELKKTLEENKKNITELQDENNALKKHQQKIDFKLKKSHSFLVQIFNKLSELKEENNDLEKLYLDKSDIAVETMIISKLQKRLNQDKDAKNFFINKLLEMEEILKNEKDINSSNILKKLNQLGEEIVNILKEYGIDKKMIVEELTEISTLLYGASSGYYSFIIPLIGSSFLQEQMDGKFNDTKNGDIIKSVENWGIMIRNTTVYKAKVTC